MGHVALLGDSIFDNARYVAGGPSVIEHLRRALPNGWGASLLAVDGAVAEGVVRQLQQLPGDASHLVVSAGGNNALDHHSLILHETAQSFAEVLTRMGEICLDFQREYRGMLQAMLSRELPTVVCTIYDAIPGLGLAELSGLRLFNEIILHEAFYFGLPVIDLRLICSQASDYSDSSPIEPSVSGGFKIAKSVVRAVTDTGAGCRIFA